MLPLNLLMDLIPVPEKRMSATFSDYDPHSQSECNWSDTDSESSSDWNDDDEEPRRKPLSKCCYVSFSNTATSYIQNIYSCPRQE